MSKDALVGRYRRAYPRIWRHPSFQQLTPAQRNIALYVLLGPQTNRIGLFHFSIGTAAEDLSLGADTCRTGLRHVCLTFGWVFDDDARVLYVPSWWRWNCPENESVLRGNLKDLSEIPPCGLVEAFTLNLAHVPPDLHDTFIETCRTRLPGHLGPQYQYQEQKQNQDQEQKPSARRAGWRTTKTQEPINGASSEVPAHLVKAAHQTLKLTSPTRPLDELVDAFKDYLKGNRGGDCSTSDAQAALNIALAADRRLQ